MTLYSIELTVLYTFALVFVLADSTNTPFETFDRVISSIDNLPVILNSGGDGGGPEELQASASSVQAFRAPPIQPIPSIIISSDFSAGHNLDSRPTIGNFREASSLSYSPESSPTQHVSNSRELFSYGSREDYPSSETRTSKDDHISHDFSGHSQYNGQTQYDFFSVTQPQYHQSSIQAQQSQRSNFDTQQYAPQQIQRSEYDQQFSHSQSSDQFHQNHQSSYDQPQQQQNYYTYTSNYDPHTRQPQWSQQSWYNDNSYQTRGPNNEPSPEGDPQLSQDQAALSDSSAHQSQEGQTSLQTSAEDQSSTGDTESDQTPSSSSQEKNSSVQIQPKVKPKRRGGLLGRINQRLKQIKKSNSAEGPGRPRAPSPVRDGKSSTNKGDNDQEASTQETPPEQVILQPSEEQPPSSQQPIPQSTDLRESDSPLQKTAEDAQIVDQESAPTPSPQDLGTPDQQPAASPSEDGPPGPQKRNRNRATRVRKVLGKRRRFRPGVLKRFKNGSRALVRARAAFRARNGLGEQQLVRDSQSQDAKGNRDQDGDLRAETHDGQEATEPGTTNPSTEIPSENRGSAGVIQKEQQEDIASSSKSTRKNVFRQSRQFVRPGANRDREDNANEGQNKSASSSPSPEIVDPKQATRVRSGLAPDEMEDESEKRSQLLHRLNKNQPLQPELRTPADQAHSQHENNHGGDGPRGTNLSDRITKDSQLSVQFQEKNNEGQLSAYGSQNDGDLQRQLATNPFEISQYGQQATHPLNPIRRGNDHTTEITAGNQASNRNVAQSTDQQRDGFASDTKTTRKIGSTSLTNFRNRQQDIRLQDQRQRNDQVSEILTTSQISYQNGAQQTNQQQDSFSLTNTRRVPDPIDQATFVNVQLESHLQEQRGRTDAITESRNQHTNQNSASLPNNKGQTSFRETARDATDLAHQNTFSNTQQRNRLQNQQHTNAQAAGVTARGQFSNQNPDSSLNQGGQGSIQNINDGLVSRPPQKTIVRKSSRRRRLRKQRIRGDQTPQVTSRNRLSHRNVASEPNPQVQNSFSNSRRIHTSRSPQRVNTNNQQDSHFQSQRQRYDQSAAVTSRNRPSYQNVAFQTNQQRQSSSRNAVSTDAFGDNYQVNTFQNQQQTNNEFSQVQPRNQASYRNEKPQSNQHQQNPFSHSNNERASNSGQYTIIGNSRGRLQNPVRRRNQNVEITTGRSPSYQYIGTNSNQYQQNPFSNRESKQIPSSSQISNTYQRENGITSTDSHKPINQYDNHSYTSSSSIESSREHSSPDFSHSPGIVSNDFQSHPDTRNRAAKLKKPTNSHGHPAFTTELQPGSTGPINSFQSTFETQTYNDRSAGRRTSSRKSNVLGGSRSQSSARKKSRDETIGADAVSLLHSSSNRKSTSISRHNQGFPPARETSQFVTLTENTHPSDSYFGVDEEYFAEIVHSPVFPQAGHDYFEWKIATSKRPNMNEFPNLTEIPHTGFTCNGKRPGYYADNDERAKCQSFHFCGEDGRRISYLCPEGTVFNQRLKVCDHVFRVRCRNSQTYHHMNERLYGHNYQLALGDFTTAFRDFGKKLNS